MTEFIYPTETADFQTIRENGMIYVDKTDLMYNLVRKHRYVFLARPRRFGKSLLCSTFKAYFEGKKELFEGLKVMDLEKEWKKHHVLHFDMSKLRNMSIPEAKSMLENSISAYEKIYGRNPEEITPGARFSGLIHRAAEQTGESVVVILDEYDSPILRLMYDEPQQSAMRTMLREFYQVLKSEGAYLRFVFITGITKFAQLSIFSELNNLKQISLLDDYSGLCGITQEELDTVLRPCVQEFADGLGISIDEAYAILKKNYDGYHFSKKGKDVYAPFSLLNALCDKEINYYWFESATSTALIKHLQHYDSVAKVFDYDGITVSEGDFSIPCEDAETPLPLLYQSGYLTIASYDPLTAGYELKIPNTEVRRGLVSSLMPIILKRSSLDNNSLSRSMTLALYSGNLHKALLTLQSYIAQIPYDIITKEEWDDKEKRESFYKLLIYMVFSILNSTVDVEVKSILGRADVIIKTPEDIFILELKVDKTVAEALEQIDNMGYATPFGSDPRRVIKCGVNISSEKRNLEQWIITDAAGNVIVKEGIEDEQK